MIAADGRSSLVRTLGLLPVEKLGAPMDVFWFSVPKAENRGDALRGSIETGQKGQRWLQTVQVSSETKSRCVRRDSASTSLIRSSKWAPDS